MIDQEFWSGGAASGIQIDRLLAHYQSPFVGKGDLIASLAKREGVNPIVLLAIMQEESSFGNARNAPTLKPENLANPFSVHFNPGANGIAKLRLSNGDLATFEQSLDAVVDALKLFKASPTPLAAFAKHIGVMDISGWTGRVRIHFETQKRRVSSR